MDGNNAKLAFQNNQELSEEEIISRQDDMNRFVLQNADAVEEAIVEHDEAIEKIQ